MRAPCLVMGAMIWTMYLFPNCSLPLGQSEMSEPITAPMSTSSLSSRVWTMLSLSSI